MNKLIYKVVDLSVWIQNVNYGPSMGKQGWTLAPVRPPAAGNFGVGRVNSQKYPSGWRVTFSSTEVLILTIECRCKNFKKSKPKFEKGKWETPTACPSAKTICAIYELFIE